ncbi:LytR/AlgR family response regulator transcription factor [Bacillus sp. T33-2]|uniref:LytR/AlgR family response regulator transcription factor n=1 Tax=Bacillus sp. T33-2 TaxID=2054168 RepID=UPI000C781B3C|nr:LytTR family DNA-binding domain-containing protein [Bacillus sp. T33-2]PLR96750.1 DNA-binding response regulator [Bacillus sp. T33-2]
MKVLIAEDDLSSRKLLKYFIQSLPNYEIVAEATDGEELIQKIVTEKPDLALVDIGLPMLNGMDAIKSCIDFHPGLQVIFITGSDDYALEAFEVRALDYILKPIERNRLYSALDRAAQAFNRTADKVTAPKKDLMIRHQHSIIFVPFNDILFIERFDRKSVVHTWHKLFETNETLANLDNLLDSRFMASHRSYIINMDHLIIIEACGQSYRAHFNGYDKTAKVSRQKLGELQHYKSI